MIKLAPPAKLTRHQRRAMREFMIALRDMDTVAGWGIVLWSKNGQQARSSWDCGGAMPTRLIPEYCRTTLEYQINKARE